MTINQSELRTTESIEQTCWRLDRARSLVEFETANFWGLTSVKGQFGRFEGVLDFSAHRVVDLTIDAHSIDTNNSRRDKHLRSATFFDAENHPQVRYLAEHAELEGEHLKTQGMLLAGDECIPLEVEAALRPIDGGLEVEAMARIDLRALNMTWSPLGMVSRSSTVRVRGRLVPEA